MKFQPKGKFIAILGTAGVMSVAFVAGAAALATIAQEPQVYVAVVAYPSPLTLDPARIVGRAAILYDPTDHRVLFQKNSIEILPLASIAKLMTAQTVLARVPGTQKIVITKKDLIPDGDWGLKPGDIFQLSQLIRFGFIASSNDAMAAVAASLGTSTVDKMNATAKDIGLSHMSFYNPTGLDIDATTSGAYGSASEVALLAAAFYKEHPAYFEMTQDPSVSIGNSGTKLTARATAAPLLSIPGFIGAKTGYTDLAGGNLVAIFDVEIGHPLIAVVLGSTEKSRFDDVRTMINAAREDI